MRRTVRREQSYGFPGSAQLKAGMQIASCAILGRVVVRPNEQKTARGNERIRRDAPFVRLREGVGKIIAGEIDCVRIRIVELEPILIFAVDRIGKSARRSVVSHPLVDDDRQRRRGWIV